MAGEVLGTRLATVDGERGLGRRQMVGQAAISEVQDTLGEVNWSSRKVSIHATSYIRYLIVTKFEKTQVSEGVIRGSVQEQKI